MKVPSNAALPIERVATPRRQPRPQQSRRTTIARPYFGAGLFARYYGVHFTGTSNDSYLP